MDNAPLNPGHLNERIMPTLHLFSLGGKLSYPSLCTGLQHRILDWAVEPGSDICCHLNWTGVKLALMFLKDLFVHPDTLQSTVPSPDEEGSSVLMKHSGFSWEPWINKQLLDLKKKKKFMELLKHCFHLNLLFRVLSAWSWSTISRLYISRPILDMTKVTFQRPTM